MTVGSGDMAIQNLTYGSMEELTKKSSLAAEYRSNFMKSQQTLTTLLNSMDRLQENAKTSRQKGDVESAYTFLFRCCEICDLAKEHTVLSRTIKNRDSPDSRRVKEIYRKCIGELEKLADALSEMYNKKEVVTKTATSANNLRKDASPQPVNGAASRIETPSFNAMITPIELVKFVSNEKEPKSALIVDFRKDKSEIIKYKEESQISVVEIPSVAVDKPCIFHVIVNSVPVGSRPLFNKLANFDLIVMLDSGTQADPLDPATGKLKRNSPAGILYAALYDYNANHRPKAPPLYMKGGFLNWRTTYPVHVASADGSARRFQFADDEDGIRKAIAELRIKPRFALDYPDLNQNVRPPSREPSPIPAPYLPSAEPSTSISRTSSSASDDLGAFTIADNIPYIENGMPKVVVSQPPSRPSTTFPSRIPSQPAPAVRPSAPKPGSHIGPPGVDRSVKPVEHKIPVIQHPHENDVPIPGIAKAESISPAVANNVPIVTPSAHRAVSHPPTRPLIDRTTKEAVKRKNDDFQRRVLSVYRACVQDLRGRSHKGHVKPGYTGLENISNTCFMNSTLQALSNTPSLRTLFCEKNFLRVVKEDSKMGSDGAISAAFTALLETLWSGEYTSVHPQVFRSVFADVVNNYLANGQQHDAAEFENVLIDALHEDTNIVSCPKAVALPDFNGENINEDAVMYDSISKQFSDSPIRQIFNLQTVLPKRCTSCRKQTVVFEGMFSIVLDIRSDGHQTTLNECLERYFCLDEVDVECSHCKKLQRMKRNTKMWKLPKVLVIQLKRFGGMGNNLVKKENNVRFEKRLDVRPFLHEKADASKSEYHLYSVTNHVGTLNSGHYKAYVKNPKTKQWLEYNDRDVKPISEDSLQTSAAFVLYYTNDLTA